MRSYVRVVTLASWGAAAVLVACSTSSSSGPASALDASSSPVVDASDGSDGGDASTDGGLAVLVYSRTLGYRHDSIPAALAALGAQGVKRGWSVIATEDPDVFTSGLASARVVVFCETSGNDILSAAQKSAFEAWIGRKNGFVGIHSATDTEYAWPFYHALVGATFRTHPPGLYDAAADVVDPSHPVSAPLPSPWLRTDEWYSFVDNPADASGIDVLLTLDESSFGEDAAYSMTPHPIEWAQTFEGARSFYTSMGHTPESYADPTFADHLGRAVEWAASR